MPTVNFFDLGNPTLDDNSSFLDCRLCLKKQDPITGKWSRIGDYIQGETVFPTFRARKITELYSLEEYSIYDCDADNNPLGTIDYQISNDDGTTWYYWDGGAWSVAGATDFSVINDMVENLPDFPYATTSEFREITIKARLTPVTDAQGIQHTPCLIGLRFNFELCYNFEEDFKRSMKRYLDSKLGVKARHIETLESATDTFTIDSVFAVGTGISAYNLTTDPGRQTNIFDSNVTETITLTAPQSIGDDIEVNYYGTAKVYIGADAHFNVSTVPAYVLVVESTTERKELRYPINTVEKRQSDATQTSRLRRHPFYHEFDVSIAALANSEVGSLGMADALRKALADNVSFTSLDSGEFFTVLDFEVMTEADIVTEGVFGKISAVTVFGAVQDSEFTETPLATEIDVGFGGFTYVESNIEVTE